MIRSYFICQQSFYVQFSPALLVMGKSQIDCPLPDPQFNVFITHRRIFFQKQGKVINKIIEETGVKIDISDEGSVNVCGTDEAMIDRAIAIITSIVTDIEAGMVFTGKVVRIMNFGAFVQLAPNKDGMVHISKLSDKRVGKVEDVVNIGDEVTVKVTEVDKMGRINLTMRPSDLAE